MLCFYPTGQHAIDAIIARVGRQANPIFSLAKTPATRPSQYPRQRKMILTNCAACAAPLPHKAKQCSRCKTRYCGPACQKKHWDEGGVKKWSKIKSGFSIYATTLSGASDP